MCQHLSPDTDLDIALHARRRDTLPGGRWWSGRRGGSGCLAALKELADLVLVVFGALGRTPVPVNSALCKNSGKRVHQLVVTTHLGIILRLFPWEP